MDRAKGMRRTSSLKRLVSPWYYRCLDLSRVAYRCAFYRLGGVEKRRLLFVACFPKSGSTYLMRLLCEITGFPKVHPVEFKGPNEQDFYEEELRRLLYRDGVCHQHLKGTLNNVRLAKQHRLRIVVLLRNIFDVVPSLNDHLHNEDQHCVTGYVSNEYFNMSQDEQYMFLIQLHLPWYFNFLLSWHEAQHELPVYWLTYEELFADQLHVASELLRFWDMAVNEERIRRALKTVKTENTRLNKGVAGRGKLLSEQHREAIYRLADSCNLNVQLRQRIGLRVQERQTSRFPNTLQT